MVQTRRRCINDTVTELKRMFLTEWILLRHWFFQVAYSGDAVLEAIISVSRALEIILLSWFRYSQRSELKQCLSVGLGPAPWYVTYTRFHHPYLMLSTLYVVCAVFVVEYSEHYFINTWMILLFTHTAYVSSIRNDYFYTDIYIYIYIYRSIYISFRRVL